MGTGQYPAEQKTARIAKVPTTDEDKQDRTNLIDVCAGPSAIEVTDNRVRGRETALGSTSVQVSRRDSGRQVR